MASPQARSGLYHHEDVDAYECVGCQELIEVPGFAVLTQGGGMERVQRDPENRVVWLELMEIKHAKCGEYKDAEKLAQHQEFGLAKQVRQSARPSAGTANVRLVSGSAH